MPDPTEIPMPVGGPANPAVPLPIAPPEGAHEPLESEA